MGTPRIWWHEDVAQNVGGNATIILKEPELATETVSTSTSAAASSGAAPAKTRIALIEADEAVYYRVNKAGETAVAAASTNKQIPATGTDYVAIDCAAGDTISFLDVA